MPAETRYFRSDTHTVNGLTAYVLGITNTTAAKLSNSFAIPELVTTYWGIRVWCRDSAGNETEITSGSAVAVAIRNRRPTTGDVLVTGSWKCPETALADTDAIVVRVYGGTSSPPSNLLATFITEQLGAAKLDSATWTVYYWTRISATALGYNCYFVFGSSTYDSRIANFTWSPPVAIKAVRAIGDGLVWILG